MTLSCIHFDEGCSGCSLNKSLDNPPIIQEANYFFNSEFNYNLPFLKGNLSGWRKRVKLAVRGTPKNPIIGLFKEKSHDALDIASCQMHDLRINEAVARVKEWILKEGIEPYTELGHGLLRYIQLMVEENTGEIQLTLVLNSQELPNLDSLKGGWHSLWVNFNTLKTNTIFSNCWQKVEGKDWLFEKINQKIFPLSPSYFSQSNPRVYEKAVQDIYDNVAGTHALEFYGGVGTIGLSLVDKLSSLVITEINEEAKEGFLIAKNQLLPLDQKKVEFTVLDAKEGSSILQGKDLVIVDPPRKGLATQLLADLLKSKDLKTLVYLSCGFDSFKRDSVQIKKGGFELAFAKSYLFFPGTNHIETLAIFKR